MRKLFRYESGLTLVELLAVVVILGIISAIAVPSIGGLIDNSRKDAHVANAQQMINAAKIAVAGNPDLHPSSTKDSYLDLKYLQDNGYIETVDDPDGGNYKLGTAADLAALGTSTPTNFNSYVRIDASGTNTFTYYVYLTNGERRIGTTSAPEPETDLGRDSVEDIPST